MLELLILKNFLSFDNYAKYRNYIKINKEDRELNHIYGVLDTLFEQHNRDITIDELKVSVLTKYPDYAQFVEQIEKSNIGQEVLKQTVETIREREQAYDLAKLSLDVHEGRRDFSVLFNFFDKINKTDKVEEYNFVTDDLEELYNETRHKQGLRWRLPTLNRMLGSLRRGDFGFLFARPETGKTTFLASETTYMASQLSEEDGPILWFNNEEQGSKVKVRCYQASIGCDLTKLYSNIKKAQEVYLERTHGKIKIIDSASIHKRNVEAMCKALKPSLIVFDQIDKIKGFDNDREDLRLGAIYIWARELAKAHCPVIGVCQADVTGENKKWLDMSNVANAKTSKQAEADWILGIGMIHEIGFDFVRYLHLSKNKLTGDEDTEPALRHGRIEVVIRPEIARYGEIQ